MARVYISSTFEDLKSQRQAVIRTVKALGHEVVSMEGYTASDRRPLEKCLDDVRSCDGYIGLVAFRYGFVPPGQTKSITHLEYEEATRTGHIKRLIFLVSEKVNWRIDFADADRSLVNAFRTHLVTEHIRVEFATNEQLEREVGRAVEAELGVVRRRDEIAELVPYLSDRAVQYDRLREVFRARAAAQSTAPILFVLHGDEFQCHDMFLRVLAYRMQEYPGIRDTQAVITRHTIEWPRPYPGRRTIRPQVKSSLGRELLGNEECALEDITGHLLALDGPVILDVLLLTSDWSNTTGQDISEFLHFCDEWRAIARRQPLVVCIAVKYELGIGSSFVRRFRLRQTNRKIQTWIESQNMALYPSLLGLVLPRLSSIPRSDVEQWARSEWVRRICRQDLSPGIRSIFDDAARSGGENEIPMESLASRLAGLLRGESISQES